jgi:hypothetical protein
MMRERPRVFYCPALGWFWSYKADLSDLGGIYLATALWLSGVR